MDEYRIIKPFRDSREITIESKNLHYSEISNLSGLQSLTGKNDREIHKKCKQIADLIRDIERLNV